ncbi:MAG: type II secretion system protein [Candidatus Electrothrix sp. AW1]|nr:type II secretion system protein [Candidatus Electrothrix gigas]
MKLNKLKKQVNEKGFTLIELMIVIAIIGILAAVAIPNFIAYRDKAYCSAAEKDANSIAATIADYFAIPSHTTFYTVLYLADDLNTLDGFSGGPGKKVGPPAISSPEFSALSGKNYATIGGSVANIRITLKDGSGRCPDDYMEAQADAGWDKTNRMFTKTMD